MKKKFMFLSLIVALIAVIGFLYYYYNNYIEISKNEISGRDRKECGQCHSKMDDFKKKVTHAPFVNWDCKDCHTPHDKVTNKTKLKTDLNKLCLTCHDKYKLNLAFPSQHQPFENGICVNCHNPHASDNKKLLIKPINKLCQECHLMDYKYRKMQYKHPPFAGGNCDDCHVAHYSKNKPLLIMPEKQLCLYCHYSIAKDTKMSSQHQPFQQGSCTACHNPHAAPAPKVLKAEGNNLCKICHTDIVNRFKDTKHTNVKIDHPQGDCLNCHKPHGSDNAPLLSKESIDLCKSCHGDYGKNGIGHPVNKNIKDPWNGGYLRCASCHDPHGTSYDKLLRNQNNDNLCVKCHGDKKKQK